MPALSVIIVSYNVRELLRSCLDSVYAELSRVTGQHEVFVVDNASGDGSSDMVRSQFPEALLVQNSANLGFAAANNQALLRCRGDYVMLLNPDTLLKEGSLATLVTFLETHPTAGMVGPRLTYGDGSFQHSGFAFPTLAQVVLDLIPAHHRVMESRLNGRYERSRYRSVEPLAIGHPLGACMVVNSKAIAAVGPMDERFFMYCEEVDWAMRFHRGGWGVFCVPGAVVVHFGGQSTRQFRDDMFVALWRSRFRLFHKHYGTGFRSCVRVMVSLGLWRLRHEAKRYCAAGQYTQQELSSRLDAYDKVAALCRTRDWSAV